MGSGKKQKAYNSSWAGQGMGEAYQSQSYKGTANSAHNILTLKHLRSKEKVLNYHQI